VISRIFSVSTLEFPANYSLTLFIGFAGLMVASLGFLGIREPGEKISADKRPGFKDFLKQVPHYLNRDSTFKRLFWLKIWPVSAPWFCLLHDLRP
jgi:hypothetical protein